MSYARSELRRSSRARARAPVPGCRARWGAVAALAIALAAGTSSSLAGQTERIAEPPGAQARTAEAFPTMEQAGTTAQVVSTAALEPGDVLRLRVWREPEMSGDFAVSESGTVVLPRLGPVSVLGISAQVLQQRLLQAYAQFLNNPSVEVIPLRRISVLGAVRTPGFYTVDPSVTAGETISLAGGPTPDGKFNFVELRRDGQKVDLNLMRNPELADMPLHSGDQLYVPQTSWLSRNRTWVISTLAGIGGTAALIIAQN
jgi:protein involved in polysaccharide export with SLBB domain